MPLPSQVLRITIALLCALVAGCGRPPPAEQAATLAASLAEIRAQLPADPSGEQASEIAKPAKRADKAYAALLKLQSQNPDDAAIAAAQTVAAADYATIRRLHRLANERHELADVMSGLKVRAYRATRTIAIPKLLSGLAAAARHAATTDFNQLPKLVRQTAELAAVLAGDTPATSETNAAPIKLTPKEWLTVADRIESWNTNEPAEFPLGLALAYTIIGKTGFALVELERIDPARLGDPDQAFLLPLARAVIYSRLGFTELATIEAASISGDTETGRQLLAAIHATLACVHAKEKDWKQMDRELAEAVRIWPDNPLVIFLTGERLLADGRKEQALETFAKAAAGTEGEWLAPLVEKRLREVRDSTGEAPPLLLDNGFIVKCALHTLAEQTKQSATGRKLAALLASATRLPSVLKHEESTSSPDAPSASEAPVD